MADHHERWIFDADTRGLESGLKKSAVGFGKLASGALAAGAAYGKFLQSVADNRNDLIDMETRTSVAAKTLSGLQLAAEGAGAQLSDMEPVIKGLSARLIAVRAGSAEAVAAFDSLGLSVEDIQQLGVEGTFREVADRLRDIEDPGERATLTMQTLGEAGGTLMQALGDSSLESFIMFADRFGSDIGPDAAAAAGDWQRNIATLTTVFAGFADDFAFMETASTLILDFTRGSIFLKEIGVGAFKALGDAASDFGIILEHLGTAFGQVLTGDFAGAVATLNTSVKDPLMTLGDGLEDALAGATREVGIFNTLQLEMAKSVGAGTGALGAQGEALADVKTATEEVRDEVDEYIDVIAGPERLSPWDAFLMGADLAKRSLQTLSGVYEVFGKDAEKAAKAAFIAQKGIAIADIGVKTAQSVMAALTIPPPAGPVLAGINAGIGAVQLATVIAAQPGQAGLPSVGGGASAGAASTPSAASSAPAPALSSVFDETAGGGGSSSSSVEIVIGHHVFEAAMRRSLQNGGAARNGRRRSGRSGARTSADLAVA